ncbi:unnamed protein product, partial [Choristocarpus tenellus]
RRDFRVPVKLCAAHDNSITKPQEVPCLVVKQAFRVMSKGFPFDLRSFVKRSGVGISTTVIRDLFATTKAMRKDWDGEGRHFPRKVKRDTLQVEDVLWALRVRKTRREFDKWEVKPYRNE